MTGAQACPQTTGRTSSFPSQCRQPRIFSCNASSSLISTSPSPHPPDQHATQYTALGIMHPHPLRHLCLIIIRIAVPAHMPAAIIIPNIRHIHTAALPRLPRTKCLPRQHKSLPLGKTSLTGKSRRLFQLFFITRKNIQSMITGPPGKIHQQLFLYVEFRPVHESRDRFGHCPGQRQAVL